MWLYVHEFNLYYAAGHSSGEREGGLSQQIGVLHPVNQCKGRGRVVDRKEMDSEREMGREREREGQTVGVQKQRADEGQTIRVQKQHADEGQTVRRRADCQTKGRLSDEGQTVRQRADCQKKGRLSDEGQTVRVQKQRAEGLTHCLSTDRQKKDRNQNVHHPFPPFPVKRRCHSHLSLSCRDCGLTSASAR